MSDDNLFRTSRMSVIRGANLMFMPGESVFLQRDVQEYKRGTAVKVISVQAVRPGEYRYQVLIADKKMWAFESDLRHTAPDVPQAGAPNPISATQRMQTLTLSQRMAALADTPSRPNPDSAATRMHTSTQAERMQRMLQTNRMRTLGVTGVNPALNTANATAPAVSDAPAATATPAAVPVPVALPVPAMPSASAAEPGKKT